MSLQNLYTGQFWSVYLVGVVVGISAWPATKIVGVAAQKWAWSEIFARAMRINTCPGLSSYKLGNYALQYME